MMLFLCNSLEILTFEKKCDVCWVCKAGNVGQAHQCVMCKRYVHAFCGKPAEGYEEGYGQKVVCSHCSESNNNGKSVSENGNLESSMDYSLLDSMHKIIK